MSTFDYKEKHTKAELIESVVLSVESNLGHVEIASESSPEENSPTESQNILDSCETPPSLGSRYNILGLVGTGGMGTVWKVHDRELDEDFAIKVLKPELVTDETALKRFQKEANLASELTHANIAAIFGPGEDGAGRPYIIMRYVDGDSLADILKREGKLSEERAMDIFSQLCEALSHSHMNGIIHRDIKPSNIIISKTESGADLVQLVDFGIARCVYDEVTKTQALTKAVDVFGSPRYMSPEQLLGQEVNAQSDIYSLGIVLYEMLTGEPPFTDENPVKLIMQQVGEQPDYAKLPHNVVKLIELCIAKSTAQRLKNIEDLIKLTNENRVLPLPSTPDISALLALCSIIIIAASMLSDGGFRNATGNGFIFLITWATVFHFNFVHNETRPSARKLEYFFIVTGTLLLAVALPDQLSFVYSINILKQPPFSVGMFDLSLSVLLSLSAFLLLSLQKPFEIYLNHFNKLLNHSTSQYVIAPRRRYSVPLFRGMLAVTMIGYGAFCGCLATVWFIYACGLRPGEEIISAMSFDEMIYPTLAILFGTILTVFTSNNLSPIKALKQQSTRFGLAWIAGILATSLFLFMIRSTGIIDAIAIITRDHTIYSWDFKRSNSRPKNNTEILRYIAKNASFSKLGNFARERALQAGFNDIGIFPVADQIAEQVINDKSGTASKSSLAWAYLQMAGGQSRTKSENKQNTVKSEEYLKQSRRYTESVKTHDRESLAEKLGLQFLSLAKCELYPEYRKGDLIEKQAQVAYQLRDLETLKDCFYQLKSINASKYSIERIESEMLNLEHEQLNTQ